MATSLTCRHGQTDSNKNLVNTIMEAAAVAVAGINTAAAIKMADWQYEIAKQYLDIAKWWRNYYNSAYKPWEDKELEEAWALEEEKPLYDIAVGRSRTYGRLQFKGLAEKSIQCTSEYCTGLREALLKDVLNSEATTLAALSGLGYRNERAFIEARNDVRWKRRTEVMNRGRDMMANNIQFSQLSFGIFGDLGKQAGKGAAGALRYLGYSWNKNETQYPTLMRGRTQQMMAPMPMAAPAATPAPEPAPEPTIRSGVVVNPDGSMQAAGGNALGG